MWYNIKQAVNKSAMEKITGIKAVTFDGDGTLWDFDESMRYALSMVHKELEKLDSVAAAMLNVDDMIVIRNRVADKLLQKQILDPVTIRREAFCQTLMDIGRPDNALASHLNDVYLKHRLERPCCFSDAYPALKALSNTYTLGVISNGNTRPEQCGLTKLFKFVILSQDYGIRKPDLGIFTIALSKAKCLPREILHVGDSIEEDVSGAIQSGFRCVWLNRSLLTNDLTMTIDYEIKNLSQLMDIL